MDKLQTMMVFVAVAEERGFAAAARRLRMSPPAVTRAIANLEERLGAVLLLRTTRQVRLTETGQQYLQDARRILTEIHDAEESVSGNHGDAKGHLVVTAPAMFGRLNIMPIITEFLTLHPKVNVSAIMVDRVTNLMEEGIDVGIRIGELPDSNLRSIRVGSVKFKTVAAPGYLRVSGTPTTPQALLAHRLVLSTAGRGSLIWRFYDNGNELSLNISPAISCNTNDSAIAAVTQGFGITRVLSYQVATEISEGVLTPLLEEFDGPSIPVSLVHPQGRNVPAKVRAFMDLAGAMLKNKLAG